jgi:hypothetical protein
MRKIITHARGSPECFVIGEQLEADLGNLICKWQSGLGNLAIVFVNALTTWQLQIRAMWTV